MRSTLLLNRNKHIDEKCFAFYKFEFEFNTFTDPCPMLSSRLHPQHETSRDFEIQTNEDLRKKFRKQPESLSIIPLNSQDKEEALEC